LGLPAGARFSAWQAAQVMVKSRSPSDWALHAAPPSRAAVTATVIRSERRMLFPRLMASPYDAATAGICTVQGEGGCFIPHGPQHTRTVQDRHRPLQFPHGGADAGRAALCDGAWRNRRAGAR